MSTITNQIRDKFRSVLMFDQNMLILAALLGFLAGFASTFFRWMIEFFESVFSVKGFSLAGIAFFCLIGLSIYLTNGLKNLKLEYGFSDLERQNYSMIHESTGYDVLAHTFSEECIIWSRDIGQVDVKKVEDCFSQYGPPYVVLGDSHAGNVQNILAKSNRFEFIIGI